MKQSQIFYSGEGDAWYRRNKKKLVGTREDPVTEILSQCRFIKPRRILEIGCANGWRLAKLNELYGLMPGDLYGIDPSWEAAEEAGFRGFNIRIGTADWISWKDATLDFDLVILGFCMYLVDREDVFRVVSEADRVLADNGCLVILDFVPPIEPYRVKYHHKEGIWSYHMDYPKLFLANPAYKSVISYAPPTAPGEPDVLVSVLQKKMALAYHEGEPVI